MERKGTFKVDFLKKIETEVQTYWDEEKIHEVDAPTEDLDNVEKFMTTFPFPYMNGKLHLGHVFSLSKSEFAARYNRLKGKLVLFPFGFHATGMPIKACADKLKRETEEYGNPPCFPNEIKTTASKTDDPASKGKSKKSKALAKTGTVKYQWEIMKSLGVPDDEIINFCEASHWLKYFPPLAIEDLKSVGLHVDWRRMFITTDVNPFFDSFVRWQFKLLKEMGKIKFGERYTIFSPRDGQACMDHDRASGEGVGPQEYTLIKLKLQKPYPFKFSKFKDQNVFLVAATMRPETMYGQTNCWVKPELEYFCFENKSKEILICTKRSATNMAYQGFTAVQGQFGNSCFIYGKDLIGCKVQAPLSKYPFIYVLPMLAIKPDKGTGVVTSVPSDSADDYIHLEDLKQNKNLRNSFNITDEMIVPFEVVPVIEIPDIGQSSAVITCQNLNITSVDDVRLVEAKDVLYTKGFYSGVMIVGEFSGQKVKDVKKLVSQKLIDNNEAYLYYEPEKEVMSRSGEECVVALCDQWYLDYGEENWRNSALECLNSLETFHDEVKNNFLFCLDWLHEYACCRRYGLGTKLPWDESWVIESLSDSTIYNSYYTISHFLQGNSLTGCDGNEFNIKPEDMTDDIWSHIFLDKPLPHPSNISEDVLNAMKNEFSFWYPVDVRCSGKDLIQNHLTFFIYIHTAIWEEQPQFWPKGIRANGHLMLNSAKMSKSEGNFLTLSEAVEKYGADGMRLALADAGDSIEDANFVGSVADAGILKLYTFAEWAKEMTETAQSLRSGPYTFHDKVFLSEINIKIEQTDENYSKMLFKEALRTGFFEMQTIRDKYRELSSLDGMHVDLVEHFIETQVIILSPICPHISDYIYRNVLKKPISIVRSLWPLVTEIDSDLVAQSEYLMETAHSFRLQLKAYINHLNKSSNGPSKPTEAHVWVAKSYPVWQQTIIEKLLEIYNEKNCFPNNRVIAAELGKISELKRYEKRVMPFAQMLLQKFEKSGLTALSTDAVLDEADVLEANKAYLLVTLNVEELFLHFTDEPEAPEKIQQETTPGSPHVMFSAVPAHKLKLVNPEPRSGLIQEWVKIKENTPVIEIYSKLKAKLGIDVELYRWENSNEQSRKMRTDHFLGKSVKVHQSSTLVLDNANFFIKDEEDVTHSIGSHLLYVSKKV